MRDNICKACQKRKEVAKQRGSGLKTSVNNTFASASISIPDGSNCLQSILNTQREEIARALRRALDMQGQTFWQAIAKLGLIRHDPAGIATNEPTLCTPRQILLREEDIDEQIENAINILLPRSESFALEGSNWVFDHLISLDIDHGSYDPVGGSSYIPLPDYIVKKRAIINVNNKDDRCFAYSNLAQLYPQTDHVNRVSHYKRHFDDLNFENISFPIKIKDIYKFEDQNPTISVGVLQLNEDNRIVPLYTSKESKKDYITSIFYTFLK